MSRRAIGRTSRGQTFRGLIGNYKNHRDQYRRALHVEPLEDRRMLADDFPNYMAQPIVLSGSAQTFTGSLGSGDTNDYYQIAVRRSSALYIALPPAGLTANVDVELIEDKNNDGLRDPGEVEASGDVINYSSPSLDTLFYIRVYLPSGGSTNYSLVVSGTNATKPVPDLRFASGIPDVIVPGQSFEVTVSAENDAGLGGPDSAINASVLYSDGGDNVNVVLAPPTWAADYTRDVSPGFNPIYRRGPEAMTAADNLIEAGDKNWKSGEQHNMTFTVTPQIEGILYIRVRTTMRDGVNFGPDADWMVNDRSINDGSNGTDQQNWGVRQIEVRVEKQRATIEAARIPSATWIDHDGDGYASALALEWDASLNVGTMDVYANVQADDLLHLQRDLGNTATYMLNTANRQMSFVVPVQAKNLEHATWDFQIDLYRVGTNERVGGIGMGADPDLNDVKMELPSEDPTPRILQVPYFNQDGSQWCWATSLAMILRYYGYDRDPWQIAADFDKQVDQGLKPFELFAFEDYLETFYDRELSDAWQSQIFFNNNNLISKLQEVLSGGHPVWMGCWDADHAVVVTGYDGVSDSSHVFINDPSGALTGSPLIQHQLTWAEFISKVDTSFFVLGDVFLVYAKTSSHLEVPTEASIQVLPGQLSFYNNAAGIVRYLELEWDGTEPYSGYRYRPGDNGWYSPDRDQAYDNYGYNATSADSLRLWASYSAHDVSDKSYYLHTVAEVRRASDNALIQTITSGVDLVNGLSWVEYPPHSSVTWSLGNLANGTYKLVVRLLGNTDNSATFTTYDQTSFYFGVTAAPSKGVAGDYSNNGVVDGADYVLWRDKLGQLVTLPNDATPGTVTQADYDVWRANFGKTLAGASASVAEPSAIVETPAAAPTIAASDEPGGILQEHSVNGRLMLRAGILSAFDSDAPPEAHRKTTLLPRFPFAARQDDLLATLVMVRRGEVQPAVAPTGDSGAHGTLGDRVDALLATIDLAIEELGSDLSRGRWKLS